VIRSTAKPPRSEPLFPGQGDERSPVGGRFWEIICRPDRTVCVPVHGAASIPGRALRMAMPAVGVYPGGKVRRAARPGYRPRMRAGDGSDRLGEALAALREEESW
jgi:hypothetical protein